MTQQTHIQISKRNGNTDVTVVSNGQGEINIDISDTQGLETSQIQQLFQALVHRQMEKTMGQMQQTQALMMGIQQLAQSSDQTMIQALEEQVQTQERKPALEP
jgi:hypothetical protein